MNTTINIEEKVSLAKQYFKEGYNCAQAVALAYSDVCNMDSDLLARASIAFGGGFGRQREVCGAVSGAGMVLGLTQTKQPSTEQDKKMAYASVQQLSSRFSLENGAYICGKLLDLKQVEHTDEPTPEARTEDYYRRRPCAEYVASAARIVGEMINQENAPK